MEQVILVDEHDNVIGHKERSQLTKEDRHRVSVLWVQNSQGDILIAKRSKNKQFAPNKWGPAAAGTNDKGETYESNILKEAVEEIGLKDFAPIHSFKDFRHNIHQWFFAIVDKDIDDFIIQKEEVAKLKWISKEELLTDFETYPEKYLSIMGYATKYFSNIENHTNKNS